MSDSTPSSAKPDPVSGDPPAAEAGTSAGSESPRAGRGRYLPSGWGRFVLALPLVAILVIRTGDFTGDFTFFAELFVFIL